MQKSDHAYAKARRLRKTMSLPEVLLWQELRGKKSGLKFRRQHPVGAFVVDFYCPAAKVAVEIDGIVHDMGDRPQSDTARDNFLATKGIRVIRISAIEVMCDSNGVAAMIAAACHSEAD